MTSDPAADAEGPAFAEPWEAQAFALTIALYEAGAVTWPEWTSLLAEEIAEAQRTCDRDTGESYYRHWLRALERLVGERGLSDPATLERYRLAWKRAAERTPHGRPIELAPEDFQ